MFEWSVKKEDIIHWFKTTQELCAGTTSSTTTSCDLDAVKESDLHRSPFPTLTAMNFKRLGLFGSTKKSGNDGQNESLFLEKLRSNPSLMRTAGSSFDQSVVTPVLKNHNTMTDQHSIASNTLPDSENGEDELRESFRTEKHRYSTKFLLCVVLAFFLAIFSVGLGVALMLKQAKDSNVGSNNTITTSSRPETTSSSAITTSSSTQQLQSEEVSVKYNYTSNSDYLVGAYYYPWYGDNFHKGNGYLRQDLIPPQQPELGEYNDSDPQVIAQHMKWFRQANIGLLVTSWWGPDRIEDTNTKKVIMEHEDIGNLKIALHYETTGRIKDNSDMTVPRGDIQYICENYFDHPNYYKIDGRPVLFVYVTRVLHKDGVLEEALLTMRSEASKCGHNLYLIGDQVFNSAPDPNDVFVPFWYFDAVTNYDVYGSSGRPDGYAGKDAVDEYYLEQEKWKSQALLENCRYIPPVSPGYNDRSVRLEKDNPALSRRLTADSEEGSLFWYQLQHALKLVDPLLDNMIIVNSFNEWHEDTQIEPAVSIIGSITNATAQPELYTEGLEYVGYGELYVDILGAATSRDDEGIEI
uniref:Uncharacterized protein n=1 Tax=Pseudo-nitzschia australis TaxID=44445 RepID=A0A7S4AA28_9STRA|mmetsp:Transcript_26977/g.59300  ORF Transcript_26977/g.59300 Transcript_26977/m.59300 type:complete len:579 (-) Transcript_26977:248-1984(-)